MKHLNDILKESLLDDDLVDTADEFIIMHFLRDNYQNVDNCQIRKDIGSNGKYVVDCKGKLIVKNKSIISLTNGLFEFGIIKRDFICHNCTSLTSLEGAPKEVGEDFICRQCTSLTSLKGAPKEIGESFDCTYCTSLTSLEGAPKEVGGTFNCSYCTSLTSLKGAPKKVGKNFYCVGSKGGFTKEEVQNIAQVKGDIM